MKYVKAVVTLGGVEMVVPLIFPNNLNHKDVADALQGLCATHWPTSETVIESAGFIKTGALLCSGESESLGLKSHQDDSMEISIVDYHPFR